MLVLQLLVPMLQQSSGRRQEGHWRLFNSCRRIGLEGETADTLLLLSPAAVDKHFPVFPPLSAADLALRKEINCCVSSGTLMLLRHLPHTLLMQLLLMLLLLLKEGERGPNEGGHTSSPHTVSCCSNPP